VKIELCGTKQVGEKKKAVSARWARVCRP
jgi:hypothetical protein